MPSTWEDIIQDPDFSKYTPEDRISIAHGFYQWKSEKNKLNISEEDFVNSIKPDIYGKAGLYEAGVTGLMESMAGTSAPFIQAKEHLLGRSTPSLEDITQNLVGEERLQRIKNAGILPTVVRGVGHLAGELPKYILAEMLTEGAATLPLLEEAGLALKAATGLPAATIPSLVRQATTFGAVGAYGGIAKGEVAKGAVEGALTAIPFTAANLSPSIIKRILGTAAVGGVMAAASGAEQKDIISNTILMGVLGGLSKQLKDVVTNPNVTDKGINNAIKNETGKSIEQITEDYVNKELPNYKSPPIEGQPIDESIPPIDESIPSINENIPPINENIPPTTPPIITKIESYKLNEPTPIDENIPPTPSSIIPKIEEKPNIKLSKAFMEERINRLLLNEKENNIIDKNIQNQEQEIIQRSTEERFAAKAEIDKLKADGVPEGDPRYNKPMEVFTRKIPTISKPESPFTPYVDNNKIIENTKDIGEFEESRLLDKNRFNDTLYSGVDPTKLVEAIKMGKDVFNNLTHLSHKIIIDGILTFKDFVYKMKDYLGDLFVNFSDKMSELYKAATSYIKDQSGMFMLKGRGERGGVPSDSIVNINLIDKLIRGSNKVELLVHENVDLIGNNYKAIQDISRGKGIRLGKILKFPNLFKSYNFDSNILEQKEVYSTEGNSNYDPFKDVIFLNNDLLKSGNREEILDTILHEVSHNIGEYDKLYTGTSPAAELNQIVKKLESNITNKSPEFKHDMDIIHNLTNKLTYDSSTDFTREGVTDIENKLNKYIDVKSGIKNLYPQSGGGLYDLSFDLYNGNVAEVMARLTKTFRNYSPEELKNLDMNKIIKEEGGKLLNVKQGGRIISLDAIKDEDRSKFLDSESSLNEKQVYETTKPYMDGIMEKGINALDYISRTVREAIRVPFHSEFAKDVTNFWHNKIERRGVEVTSFARNKFKPFLNLPPDMKEKIARDSWSWDIAEIEKTPIELTKLGYTPEMITAYQGIRSGLDYMHGSFLRSELSKLFTDRMTDTELSKIIDGYKNLPKDIQDKVKRGVANTKADEIIGKSKITGFIPRYRFGRYVVHITDGKGDTIWNEGFETQPEAQNFLSKHPDNSRIIDTKYEKVDIIEMMTIEKYIPLLKKVMIESGIPTELINDVSGLLDEQWLKVFASGKLAKREGIPGYSKDLEKSLLTYTQNFPLSILKRFNNPELSDIVRSIPTSDGQRAYAKDLVDYLYNRNNPEGKINKAARAYMWVHYLVMKPAFGALNLTQRTLMTAPWSISEVSRLKPDISFIDVTKEGWGYVVDAQQKEIRLMSDSVHGISEGKHLPDVIREADYLNIKEKSVLLHLERQGEFKALRQAEIGGTEYEKWLNRLDIFGRFTERSNRIHAALTAVNLYDDLGYEGSIGGRTSTRMKGLIDAVDNFISTTQIMYSKANRPQIARGWKAPIFMFKSFMLGYLNLYYKMLGDKNKAAFTNGIATTLAIGGVAGAIPARDEINKIVDGFMSTVVGDPSWPTTKQSYINSISNTKISRAIMYGIPSMVGIDASSMVGFPNVSGSALLPIAQGALDLPKNMFRPDMTTVEKYKTFLPSQANNLYKLYKIIKYGLPTDRTGKPIIRPEDVKGLPYNTQQVALKIYNELPKSISVTDKISIALGFPTIAVNKYYNDVHAIKTTKGSANAKSAELHRAIALAIIDQDSKRVENLFKEASRKGLKINTETVFGHITAYEAN